MSRQIHLLWCNEKEEWYLSWQLSNLSRLLSFPANVPPSFTSYPYLCSQSELFPASRHWPCYDLFPLFQHPTNCLSGPVSAVHYIPQIIHQELSMLFLCASYSLCHSWVLKIIRQDLSPLFLHPANYPLGYIPAVPYILQNYASRPVSTVLLDLANYMLGLSLLSPASCKLSVRTSCSLYLAKLSIRTCLPLFLHPINYPSGTDSAVPISCKLSDRACLRCSYFLQSICQDLSPLIPASCKLSASTPPFFSCTLRMIYQDLFLWSL